MKTKLFSTLLMACGLLFSSCNLEPDSESNYYPGEFPTCNFIKPASGDAYAAYGNYVLTYYYYDNRLTVGTSNLLLGDSYSSFTTGYIGYKEANFSNGVSVLSFSDGSAAKLNINDLSGYTTTNFRMPEKDPLYKYVPVVPLVMQYNVGTEYQVKTFLPDAVYFGTTTITTVSSGANFTNPDFLYRVIFNKDLKKADVVFYNAKFAERMPITVSFALKDLDVKFLDNGYEISIPADEERIPLYYAGNDTEPFPSYTFTALKLTNTSPDLTSAAITYNINNMMQGGKDEPWQLKEKYMGIFNGVYASNNQ